MVLASPRANETSASSGCPNFQVRIDRPLTALGQRSLEGLPPGRCLRKLMQLLEPVAIPRSSSGEGTTTRAIS
jgi:hypothetical protein